MRDWSQQQSPSEVVAVLSDLVLHPAQTFYHSWNWKAALLSAMLRAPLFLVVTLRQAFQDHGARLAGVREGLATALAHRWDCAALVYLSLYDAIHAEFRAADTLACFPPYAWSPPATIYADAVIAASSALAQTFFRVVDRFGRQSPSSEIPSLRYVQMVPSVTAREEKSAVTLHPRRAD